MNSILYSVFISLSLRMTVITLFVLLIKTALKSRLPSITHCLMWLIPCIQLLFCLCGIRIQTGSSLYNVIPHTAMNAISAPAAAPVSDIWDPRNIIVFVWLAGILVTAVWYLTVFFVYRSRVCKYPVVNDENIIKSASDIRLALGIPQSEKITLRMGDIAQTMPHLVILPQGYSDGEMRQILLHELCHYRHRDYAKLWAALAALCLNWFNPVIWLAFRLFRADIEMMCDERVLKLTDSKKQYAGTLVKSAMIKTRFIPGAASVHNGRNEVKTRVKRIASLKRFKPVWTAAAVCLCVTLSCLCLTDAVSVAVENTVDITATPVPVTTIPETVAAPVQEPPEEPVSDNNDTVYQAETDHGSDTYYAPEADNYSEPAVYDSEPTDYDSYTSDYEAVSEPQAVVTADEAVTENNDESADVNEESGESDDAGNKETYELDDGRTVVLQYDGENVENGYIIN